MTTPEVSASIKVDPVTAVQDSIDSLALSLFEALRGVRDAVADSSSSSTAPAAAATDHLLPMSAFHDTHGRSTHVEEYAVNNNTTSVEDVQNRSINSNGILAEQQQQQQQARDKLLDGLNLGYFPPRAYDRLNPDYESFILSYLGGEDGYAKELVERFYSLQKKTTPTTATTTTSLTSSSDQVKNEKIDQSENIDQILLDTKTIRPQLSQHQQQSNNTNLSGTVDKNIMRKGEEEEEHGTKSSSSLLTNTVKKLLGEVGYEFRKEFDSGWYTGKVVEIRPLAENGYDRRCVYSDGDIEDLRLDDLEQLAKLDPLHGSIHPTDSNANQAKKPRLCIKLNVSKNKPPHISASGAEQTSSSKSDTMGSSAINDSKSSSSSSSLPPLFPMSRNDYIQLLHDAEHHRDYEITAELAANVLSKSNTVNDLVANLPGMERTRSMQLARITELIDENQRVMSELEKAYVVANKIRDEGVRKTLGECTALALCLDEE